MKCLPIIILLTSLILAIVITEPVQAQTTADVVITVTGAGDPDEYSNTYVFTVASAFIRQGVTGAYLMGIIFFMLLAVAATPIKENVAATLVTVTLFGVLGLIGARVILGLF